LRISLDEGDALAEGYARAGTGLSEMSLSDFEAAERCFQAALPIFQEHGEEFMASLVRTWTGTTFLARGEPETARRTLEGGLESARRRGNSLGTYVALYNLAQLALVEGNIVLAADALRQGVELSEWTRDLANLAHFMEALATVAALRGEAKRSALLLGAADGTLRGVGAPVYNFYVTDPSLRERTVAEVREALGEATFEEIRARGETMTFDDAVRYALGDGPA
jgi:tetratricopeptide (TPR) repeat protein